MAKCHLCGKKTELYDNGVPICIACATETDRAKRPRRESAPERKRDNAA